MPWSGLRIGGVTTSQPSYVLWRSPDLLLRVEFRAALLEEIGEEALRTANALQGSGIEFGGVLLGTRVGDLVRILAWVPIECQHAFGPAFVLSAQDEELLAAHLAELRHRSQRTGLLPVGWFATNLQGHPEPSESHLRLHAAHFGQSRGIFLLCQPDLSGNARLHITGGPADGGKVRTYANPLLLEPAPYLAPLVHDETASAGRYSRSARWTRARTSPTLPPPGPIPPGGAAGALAFNSRRTRAWMATGVLLAALALLLAAGALWLSNQGFLPRQWALERLGLNLWLTVPTLGPHASPRQLPSLHAVYSDSMLRLAWDPAGLSLLHAIDGSVEVWTGSRLMRVPLRAPALASGRLTLTLSAPPALARLRYRTASGLHGEESVRFKPASVPR